MTDNRRIGTYFAQVIVECDDPDRFEQMMNWSKSRFKMACDNSRFGQVLVLLSDENGNLIGRNQTGELSEEAMALAELEEEEEPPSHPPVVGL